MKRGLGLTVFSIFVLMLGLFFYFEKDKKPIVLEFGMFAESNWEVEDPHAYVLIDRAIEKFEEKHPGVKIHYESGIRKADYSEWLARKTLSGNTPDIFMVLSDELYKYASLQVLEKLDKRMEEDKKFKKNYFYDSTLRMGRYDKDQYALPYQTVPTLMFVNKTLLEKEGIKLPKTDWKWSELEQITEAVTKDTDGDGRIDQFGTYNYTWKEAVYSNGGKLFEVDGRKSFFSSKRVEEAIKFIQRLQDLNQGNIVTQDDFDLGKVAFMPLSFSDYRTYKTYPYKVKKYTSFQWECITMPAGPEGENISEIDALMVAMNRKSKHKELAWEFMRLLCTDPEIQRGLFEYSKGASVLKYITGSGYAESIIRKDMEENERAMDEKILSEVIEKGEIRPRFARYSEAMALAENRITEILRYKKNIDSSLKIFQRDMTKFLKE